MAASRFFSASMAASRFFSASMVASRFFSASAICRLRSASASAIFRLRSASASAIFRLRSASASAIFRLRSASAAILSSLIFDIWAQEMQSAFEMLAQQLPDGPQYGYPKSPPRQLGLQSLLGWSGSGTRPRGQLVLAGAGRGLGAAAGFLSGLLLGTKGTGVVFSGTSIGFGGGAGNGGRSGAGAGVRSGVRSGAGAGVRSGVRSGAGAGLAFPLALLDFT